MKNDNIYSLRIINHKLCQFIVKKFVKVNTNWPKEIKIAKSLIAKHKDFKFWNNLNDLKLPSLAWFLTDNGKDFLALQDKIQNLKIKRKIINKIKENKFGEDKTLQNKPKNLLDFLK